MSAAGSESSRSGDAGKGSESGSRLRGPLGTWPRRIGVAVAALVGLLAVLYLLGIVGAPSAGLEDRGDWGDVNETRTEIVTTVWVNNPNPVGVSLGNSLTADYHISLNGVRLAEGSKTGISVPTGNSTTELRTDLLNERLPAWWVEYVRANETVRYDANATLQVNALAPFEEPVNRSGKLLRDDKPVIEALSAAANSTRGTYTPSSGADLGDDSSTGGPGDDSSVTVGYEIQRGWATWHSVSEEQTTVRFHLQVHNPGDVPVPAAPDGIGTAVDMNGIELFRAESDEFALGSVDSDAVIGAGETREVTFDVTMDNGKIDEWFTSHVRADRGPGVERTAVSAEFRVVFSDPATGTTFRIPDESPVTYDCRFSTAILVDREESETNCGDSRVPGPAGGNGSAPTDAGDSVPSDVGDSVATDAGSVVTTAVDAVATDAGEVLTSAKDAVETALPGAETPTPTATSTGTTAATGTEHDPAPPTARLSANETEGSAPLPVQFDASGSTDPNGDVERYVWSVGDGTGGPTQTRTFETAGVYTVTVTVFDSTGRQDTASVTVTVEP